MLDEFSSYRRGKNCHGKMMKKRLIKIRFERGASIIRVSENSVKGGLGRKVAKMRVFWQVPSEFASYRVEKI